MIRDEALGLLREYCDVIRRYLDSPRTLDLSQRREDHDSLLNEAAGMSDRFPASGSENKAMRWLGYIQGILRATGFYSLEELKEHSKNGKVIRDVS